ncbi:MAG TPA: glycosyltransferase [Gemmataceae bacterium]|jgi:UDP:flavonoid glycosyltransferase YjiC (YdhE family)|nr:glycosyltransferase [Gemmataceae bacterium]
MHFLFVAQGTSGDINPQLALAKELHKREHAVSFLTHTYFRELVQRHGLEFIDFDDAVHYQMLQSPDYWHPAKGMRLSARFLTDVIAKQYQLVCKHYKPGQTVAITSVNGFGVRIAHETLGIPMISAHICPWLIRSHRAPCYQPRHNFIRYLKYEPTGIGNWIYYFLGDLFVVDPLFKSTINQLRRELGLGPVSRIFQDWMHSPQRIIGLFPRWYVNPYPSDWPAHVQVTQFPQEDASTREEPPESVLRFLNAGDPPIVFSPGTGMAHVPQFFATAIDACRKLRRRGLLLTRYREQLPDLLPEFVHHEPYLPFSQLLPRAAALVSHGGIGGVAQALAAGIPQLLMPMTMDQPDNARRLVAFQVARTIHWRRFDSRDVVKHLEYLLDSPTVHENCQRFKALFPKDNPVGESCDLIEEFADKVHRNGLVSEQMK